MGWTNCDDQSIRETVAATLTERPVSVGFIFASQARSEVHDQSDIDVTVAFKDSDPGDPGYIDARLKHDDVYAALQDLNRYRDFLYDVRAYLKAVGTL